MILSTDGLARPTATLPASRWSGGGTVRTRVGTSGPKTSGKSYARTTSRSDPYSMRTGRGTTSSIARIRWLSRTADDSRGYGAAASGVATIQTTSSTATAETSAPRIASTRSAGRQVNRPCSSRPTQTAITWPPSAKASTTATAAATRQDESAANRDATGSATCAPSTAPPKKPRKDSAAVRKPCRKPLTAKAAASASTATSSQLIAPRSRRGPDDEPPRGREGFDARGRQVLAVEARDGDELRPGGIWIAPGDNHLVVTRQGGRLVLRTNQEPPENFCRPAVDALFRSLASVCGSHSLAVVLTGMGQDGFRAVGGYIIAQDKKTSVVWGMPGQVVQGGLADEVLPLGEIADRILFRIKPALEPIKVRGTNVS